MKTKEIINGQSVQIKWKFIEMIDSQFSDMAEWVLKGEGDDGNTYRGTITGTVKNPEKHNSGKVINVMKE